MTQWIAFDEESTAIAAQKCKTAVRFQHGTALDFLLGTAKSGVLILPAHQEKTLQVAVLRSSLRSSSGGGEHKSVPSSRPSGILGLTDEFIVEQPDDADEKSWWRRILK